MAAFAVLAVTSWTANDASAILWGHYALNENADEATGNNIDLNLVGDTTFGSSVHPGLGPAISFDGAGDGAIGPNFNKFTTTDVTVVATGYLASLVVDECRCFTEIDNSSTLRGLEMVFRRNG